MNTHERMPASSLNIPPPCWSTSSTFHEISEHIPKQNTTLVSQLQKGSSLKEIMILSLLLSVWMCSVSLSEWNIIASLGVRFTKFLLFHGMMWTSSRLMLVAMSVKVPTGRFNVRKRSNDYDNDHRKRLLSIGEKYQNIAHNRCVLVGNRLPSRRSRSGWKLAFE